MPVPRFISLIRRRPRPQAEGAPLPPDPRLPLHVLADDAVLAIDEGRLRVTGGEADESFVLEDLSLVALHGGARVSVPCLHALARAGVPLILHARNGWYLGQMVDLSGNHAAVRRAQYAAAADPARRLVYARAFVAAKIGATARLARRRLGTADPLVRRLDRALADAAHCRDIDRLRGIEGGAAAAWFDVWPRLLSATEGPFVFAGRSRRPPRDGANALLSYLYAVLTGKAAAAAAAAGLDPNVGFLHAERPGRPALALDLVEPLRVSVVETAVLAALNGGRFAPEDCTADAEGAVTLTPQGRRRALAVLEERLSEGFGGTTWRAAMNRAAGELARGLCAGAPPALPLAA